MITSRKIALAAAIVVILATWTIYALFHGYFDQGHFDVLHAERSSTGRVAMVARRYDEQALGGLEYFVAIGDHIFTPRELRHALYYDGVVFDTGRSCITAQWETPAELVIDCPTRDITTDSINLQLHNFQGIAVQYRNIPAKPDR